MRLNWRMKNKNHPPRVVISRLRETSAQNRKIAYGPLDTGESACWFWRCVVEKQQDFEHDKEHVVTILLDTELRPLGFHLVAIGSLNECVAHPREIFRPAIILSAYGFILLHNHPSGDPGPSKADCRLTYQLHAASLLLQVRMLDHIIVGSPDHTPDFFSFWSAGALGPTT
jgi:DNA repair protein RadC